MDADEERELESQTRNYMWRVFSASSGCGRRELTGPIWLWNPDGGPVSLHISAELKGA
jgi:hypothetical protein